MEIDPGIQNPVIGENMYIEKFNWQNFDALYDEVSEIYKSNMKFQQSDGKLILLLSMVEDLSTEEEILASDEHKKRIAVVRRIEGAVGSILEEILIPSKQIIGA